LYITPKSKTEGLQIIKMSRKLHLTLKDISKRSKFKWQAINHLIIIGDIIVKAPGFIISLKDTYVMTAT
jgi:hypothetical protein